MVGAPIQISFSRSASAVPTQDAQKAKKNELEMPRNIRKVKGVLRRTASIEKKLLYFSFIFILFLLFLIHTPLIEF